MVFHKLWLIGLKIYFPAFVLVTLFSPQNFQYLINSLQASILVFFPLLLFSFPFSSFPFQSCIPHMTSKGLNFLPFTFPRLNFLPFALVYTFFMTTLPSCAPFCRIALPHKHFVVKKPPHQFSLLCGAGSCVLLHGSVMGLHLISGTHNCFEGHIHASWDSYTHLPSQYYVFKYHLVCICTSG